MGEPKEFSLPSQPKPSGQIPGMSKEKTLDKIMKTELLADRTVEEISAIWNEYWASKDAIAAVIPKDTYLTMQERFKEFNTFLFPLPRDQGYEFVVVQFLNNEAHFTTLINYQAHKENAPECLGMMHYTELMESKGIVLMVGEYDKDVLSSNEARCLADQVEMYYSKPSDKKLDLLNKFTKAPTLFSHEDLISEMNNIQLDGSSSSSSAAEVKN